MVRNLGFAVLFAGLIGACSSNTDPFEQQVDAYTTTLQQMESLEKTHATAVQGSEDLDEAQAEEQSFYDSMVAMMEDMMGTSSMLEQCGDLSMMGMSDMMTDMEQEVESHYTAMMGADTHAAALDEESRHQESMGSMFTEMDSMGSQMMGMMDMGMDCPADMGDGQDSDGMSGGSGM